MGFEKWRLVSCEDFGLRSSVSRWRLMKMVCEDGVLRWRVKMVCEDGV